ncbi:MAG TPA: hypothetical protein VIY98_06560 [Nitrososphaeraceae archaeon]
MQSCSKVLYLTFGAVGMNVAITFITIDMFKRQVLYKKQFADDKKDIFESKI